MDRINISIMCLVPIFKTGPAGAKINWGDGTSTDIPANWDAIVDDSLTYNQVEDAWIYTTNGNMPSNVSATNVAKLCHKYSTTSSTTRSCSSNGSIISGSSNGSASKSA